MRFYAACLASYNNGVLHGRWIDASSDVDEMQAEVSEMLRASRFPNVTVEHPETGEQVPSAEEWAIHDSEGLPSSFGEYAGLAAIAEFVEFAELCEEQAIGADNASAIIDHFGKIEYATDEVNDRLAGVFGSFKEYADEQADEMLRAHDIKDDHPLALYFDYERYENELKHSTSVVELEQGVAVFYA